MPAFAGTYALTFVVTSVVRPEALVIGNEIGATWTVVPECVTGPCGAAATSSNGVQFAGPHAAPLSRIRPPGLVRGVT